MDRRTHESFMDWEYQNQGPLDPTSPFVQSMRKAQQQNALGAPSFGQNSFTRTQNSNPEKPLPPTPRQATSIFASNPQSQFQRSNTAPPFRNAAFTTPRKPFDMDPVSEVSAAESSPAVTDVSDCPETPERDNMRSLSQMTITPSRSKAMGIKKVSGKGEIPRATTFATRDKVRKRKKRHDDKDISGFRLPYKQHDEWDETDGQDSDDSTYQANENPRNHARRNNKGWFANFLTTIQKHPYAPSILGYWLQFAFHVLLMGIICWVIWIIIAGFRGDFSAARQELKAQALEVMAKCAKDYTENRCSPKEGRLPAMYTMCEEWEACMNQDPDRVRNVQLGAKNIVELFNEIFENMTWKTLGVFFVLVILLCFSGASVLKSGPPHFSGVSQLPQPSQNANMHLQHQLQWSQYPQTPHRMHALPLMNDDTPETDASPSDMKALPAPYETPGRGRSPRKGYRELSLSPTKSRSPTKRY